MCQYPLFHSQALRGNTATQGYREAAFVLSHLRVLAAPQGLIIHYKRPMI